MQHRFMVAGSRRVRCGARAVQRGISLLYALMALVALSLASVALIRSVDTGNLVMGNLGFKQDATAAADRAAEAAIGWLSGQLSGTALHANNTAQGYYAAAFDNVDVTGKADGTSSRVVVDWEGNSCSGAGSYTSCIAPSGAVSVGGNSARYVILRLCSASGAPTGGTVTCVLPLANTTAADTNRSGFDYARPVGFDTTSTGPYYRILVRVAGARGTRSFTETIVHF
jgi:Tfp pilus assembly protein PilX